MALTIGHRTTAAAPAGAGTEEGAAAAAQQQRVSPWLVAAGVTSWGLVGLRVAIALLG